MEFKNVDTIIFDFDGTLARAEIDFAEMKKRLLALAASFGIREEELQESYVLELLEEINAALEGRGGEQAKLFSERAHSLIREMELEAARKGKVLAGVEQALLQLKSWGYKLGIVTRNCTQAVETILENCDLPHDLLLTRDHVSAAKPHPAHLKAALEKLNSLPEKTILVGDSSIDIAAGLAAGISYNVGVLTGRYTSRQLMEAGAYCVLDSAAGLPALLDGCGSTLA